MEISTRDVITVIRQPAGKQQIGQINASSKTSGVLSYMAKCFTAGLQSTFLPYLMHCSIERTFPYLFSALAKPSGPQAYTNRRHGRPKPAAYKRIKRTQHKLASCKGMTGRYERTLKNKLLLRENGVKYRVPNVRRDTQRIVQTDNCTK